MVPQCYASSGPRPRVRRHRRRSTLTSPIPVKRITSRHNALVARYRAAARGAHGSLLLVDGQRLVHEALDAGAVLRHVTIATEAVDRSAALRSRLEALDVEVAVASASVMDALSPVRSPSAVVALADRPADRAATAFAGRSPLVVAAVSVQDPGNLGAIVRVAEAGGASGVAAAGRSADPFGWKALRGSMGSAFRLPTWRAPVLDELLSGARQARCRIVAAVPRGGRDPVDAHFDGPTLFLIGAEGSGLPPDVEAEVDERVTIPMAAPVESLNVAACAALLVYEARRQRHASPLHGLALPTRA